MYQLKGPKPTDEIDESWTSLYKRMSHLNNWQNFCILVRTDGLDKKH